MELGISWLLLVAVVTLILYYFVFHMFGVRRSSRPPGPGLLERIYLHFRLFTGTGLIDVSMDMAIKYGPLTYTRFMGQDMCFVNDQGVANKMLDGDTKLMASDRTVTEPVNRAFFGNSGVTFGDYDERKKLQRKLFFKAMSNSGQNNDVFTKMLYSEIKRFDAELLAVEGQDIHLDLLMADSLHRTVYILLKGDLDHEDIIADTKDVSLLMGKLAAPAIFALLSKFPILLDAPVIRYMIKSVVLIRDQMLDVLLDHSNMPSDAKQSKGLCENLLYYQLQPEYSQIGAVSGSLRGFVFSVLTAAQLTTRAAVLGLILNIINCPDVAKKMQEEIDRVIGRHRRPEASDRANMPYMRAVLLENFRHLSLNPFVARNASMDFEFEGYTVPKGSQILINNWYLTKNDEWTEPFLFNPDQFLDENGDVIEASHPKRKKVIPFGIGLRRCPGEVFAINNIFIRMTSLLQKFDVLPPAKEQTVINDPRNYLTGLALLPPPFKCRVLRRK